MLVAPVAVAVATWQLHQDGGLNQGAPSLKQVGFAAPWTPMGRAPSANIELKIFCWLSSHVGAKKESITGVLIAAQEQLDLGLLGLMQVAALFGSPRQSSSVQAGWREISEVVLHPSELVSLTLALPVGHRPDCDAVAADRGRVASSKSVLGRVFVLAILI